MSILNKQEISIISKKIADKVDIPKIPEWGEAKLIGFGIGILDEGLSKHVDANWADIIKDATKGLDGKGVRGLKEKVISEVNKDIDIPLASEEFESVILSNLYDIIAEFITKGNYIQ